MRGTELLRAEHRVILGMLDALERAAGMVIGAAWWGEAIAWLRAFADASHHAKEERVLFPAMVKAGVPDDSGPIAMMLAEHVEGRELVRTMADARGTARARAARDYVRLLRDHIAKEDEVVFPLAESVLDGPAASAVARAFDEVELEQGRDAGLEPAAARARALAEALSGAGSAPALD
jgi:hemerythrin-like domain-containing protein